MDKAANLYKKSSAILKVGVAPTRKESTMEEKKSSGGKRILKVSDIVYSILSVLAVSLYPALFLYAQNAAEADFSEIVSPAIWFAAGGIGIWLLLWLIMRRKMQQAAVIATISMLVLLNFTAIEKLMCKIVPETRYWHAVIVVVFLLYNVGLLVGAKLSGEWAGYATRILAGVFGMLIVMNVGMAVPTIMNKISAEKELAAQREQMLAQQVESDEYLPNIYYIILDEYSGFNTIKKIFNYDNEPFAQYLESLGFTVSRDSYNEEIVTDYVTANLIDLNYTAVYGKTTANEANLLRQNGRFFQILSQNGYQLQYVGSNPAYYGLDSAQGNTETKDALTVGGENLKQLLYEQTIIYPFARGENLSDKQDEILESFRFLSDPNNLPNQGIFTMVHLTFPHEPFIFDENGQGVKGEHYTDWDNTDYYLGQFKYCTQLASELMTTLVENDPNVVIILQSDHSARAASDMSRFMRLIPYNDMKNILNAVYLGGEAMEEIQQQSGVNTLRLLLNKCFDYDFELLEVPNGSEEAHKRAAGIDD